MFLRSFMPKQYNRMRPYHPRKRRQKPEPSQQLLRDWQHLLSTKVNALIILCKEGPQAQAALMQAQAKSEYLKISPQMHKLASGIGESCARAVRDYLESVDTILLSAPGWLDEAKVTRCYAASERLEKSLKVA
jgi:hypothetical protein